MPLGAYTVSELAPHEARMDGFEANGSCILLALQKKPCFT